MTEKYLQTRTANNCLEEAKNLPKPKMLFSELWNENEVCILFSDTNLGKSALAVQIADSISKGIPINGFKMEAEKQPVLYFDAEMSDLQFSNRYSNYHFEDSFNRSVLNQDEIIRDDSVQLLLQNIVQEAMKVGAKIIVIDNLSYLKGQLNPVPLLKRLKRVKNIAGLSFLILAHVPKLKIGKALTKNDISGSKNIADFVDSIFAIGESRQDKTIRYIKQIKARDTEIIYDHSNVIVAELRKTDILRFEKVGFGLEEDHLLSDVKTRFRQPTPQDFVILDLIKQNPDLSLSKIAAKAGDGVNKMKVKRVRAKFKEQLLS